MQTAVTDKELRSFGFTVGGIFALIGIWPAIVHKAGFRWWALILGVGLIVPALLLPKILFWIHKGWMFLGHVLGWVNTRIVLGLVFYLIITPVGIVRSWLGKDPMGRRLNADAETYRVVRKPRPASHLTKQY